MCEMLEMPSGSLTGAERLADLEAWNSLAMLSFIAFVDEHFSVSLSPRQIAKAETVSELGKLAGVAQAA
jgi:acyl carrier protein